MLAPEPVKADTRKVVLSGIQPTGKMHIGNYVGAVSLWVQNQTRYDNLFCIANMHALTIPEAINPKTLRQQSRETAALLLACGIDPQQSIVFMQSDVAAHAYLAWILSCCTPVGWLERMTQYKTKAAKTEVVSSGLLTYPVLQTADILAYKAAYVPVGDDQKQHLELARDVAERFNHLYEAYFPLPDVLTRTSGTRIMGMDDPSAKMSKSTAQTRSGHAIGVLDTLDVIRKTIMSAVTDTGNETRFEVASAGVRNLLTLYEVLSGETRDQIETRFAGRGYGALKRELVELVVRTLEPIQARFREISDAPEYLNDVLAQGAECARERAERTLADVRQLVGL
ncbi:MAG: tryptophan--tRNA ligase [Anaerolineae bacterium]|nr:tryptophan--tRNA ligase [Anaerolineae bacterium]